MKRGALNTFLFFLALVCAMPAALTARAAEHAAVADQLKALRGFDISCRAPQADPNKKVCSQNRAKLYVAFINSHGKEALETVGAEKKASKERLKALEKLTDLPAIPQDENETIKALADKAQQGDRAAADRLIEIGPNAVPALQALETARDIMPSPQAQRALAVLDQQLAETADAALAGKASQHVLTAPVRDAAVVREERYQLMLKRVDLSLRGAHRPTPPWFVYAYMFGLGFIPFAAGLAAAVIAQGRFDIKTFMLLMACYLAYAGTYAYFTFRAPYV